MRCLVVLVVVVVAAVPAAGCGLPLPITATRAVAVDVPFGPVDPACTAIGAGDASAGGRSFSFMHRPDNGACVLTTTGSGPFLDLAAIRRQAGPEADGSTITGVTIDVTKVALANGDAALAARSVDASLAVLGQQDVVVVHGGAATTHVSEALVHAIDEAWQKSAPITGDAASTVVVDAGQAIADPRLHLELQIHVQGTASLGG